MSEMKINIENQFKPCIRIKDPVSALSHFIGFLLAIILTPVLLSKAALYYSDTLSMASLSIYCLSLIILYGASSAYHAFVLSPNGTRILKKIDHVSIFLLIAGTYTPICLLKLKQDGILLVKIAWIIALLGTILKLFWVYCPKYVSSILYIAMGWTALFKIGAIHAALAGPGFMWLLLGGAFYTIGGIIYALKISFSRNWSEHEIFHIFVLLGSFCHYLMIFCYVI